MKRLSLIIMCVCIFASAILLNVYATNVSDNVVYVSSTGTAPQGVTLPDDAVIVGPGLVSGDFTDGDSTTLLTLTDTPYYEALEQVKALNKAKVVPKNNQLVTASPLYRAFEAIGAGNTGTVVILDEIAIEVADRLENSSAAEYKLPKVGNVTLTATYDNTDYFYVSGARLLLDHLTWDSINVQLSGKLTLKDINIEYFCDNTDKPTTSWEKGFSFYTAGNALTVDENVYVYAYDYSLDSSDGYYAYPNINIFGGARYAKLGTSGTANITIKSGTWNKVFGAGHGMNSSNDGSINAAKIAIEGGEVAEINGAGSSISSRAYSYVSNDLTIAVKGGKVGTITTETAKGIGGNIKVTVNNEATVQKIVAADNITKSKTPTSVSVIYEEGSVGEITGFDEGEVEVGAPYSIIPESMLTYKVLYGKATITDCDDSIMGNYIIPSVIDDYPVTAIGDEAFYGCEKLINIVIPKGVTSIGKSAFEGCYNYNQFFSGLESVTIPDTVTSIGNRAFYGCKSLVSIELPDGMTAIADEMFYNCQGLKTIEVPDNVETIGKYAFYGCRALENVVIGKSVTTIGGYAFYECEKLTSIEIPNSVTTIGNNAFGYCSGLTSIEIPNSVTSLGTHTFQYCRSLTSVEIPNNVTAIGNSAFRNCRSLTSIEIPDGVTSIGGIAFYYCDKLKNIEIPDSVTSIGDSAFQYCGSLTSVEIPNSVKSIGRYALGDCQALTNVVLGEGVTSIGDNAFRSCSKLSIVYYRGSRGQSTSINISSNNNSSLTNAKWFYNYYDTVDEVVYSLENNKLVVAGCDDSIAGKVIIPSKVGNYSVTKISEKAFNENMSITEVVIPDSVTTIGNEAFASCANLTSVTLGANVENIGEYAFRDCGKLACFVIPESATNIGKYAFAYCVKLVSVEFPKGITTINEGVFSGCNQLTNVFFAGTKAQWQNVTIEEENTALKNAEMSFGTHIVAELAEEQYLVSEAKCGAKAVYNKSCSDCGVVMEGTFEYGELKAHTVSENADEKYFVSEASCTAKAIYNKSCSDCGAVVEGTFEYGGFADHTPTEKVDDKYLVSPATTTQKAIYNKSCSECGAKLSETFEYGELLVLNGWVEENGIWYYYENNVKVKNGWREDSTGWCFLDADGKWVLDCFVKDSSNKWAYITKDGYYYETTDWVEYMGNWYYLEKGYRVSNTWRKDSTGWCFLDADGKWVLNAIVKDSAGYAYITEDGYFYDTIKGWKQLDGEWYFIEKGYAVTNDWRKDSIGWCFLSSTGAMVTNNFVKDSAGYAYITKDGYFYETENGWRLVNNEWYFLEKGYSVRNDWRKDSIGWCYLSANGTMVTNDWVKDSQGWCYIDKHGYWDGIYH